MSCAAMLSGEVYDICLPLHNLAAIQHTAYASFSLELSLTPDTMPKITQLHLHLSRLCRKKTVAFFPDTVYIHIKSVTCFILNIFTKQNNSVTVKKCHIVFSLRVIEKKEKLNEISRKYGKFYSKHQLIANNTCPLITCSKVKYVTDKGQQHIWDIA